ncbi:3-deoxy-D-manno-octulosonic acid transferase [Phaeobacter sp. B1627]|uniref:3-deoxy-D-manno-octulosonic acid transferase n=1 Tax=Phaeobacter sp. B1627 TaxID=2583809 RepID=UPI00111AFEF5|nr:3-deoxy-D-manno-octulosonic acid transferase [Phaeobacter sp. B1627]TNJ42698.1 3-deoxy-D-manno-octulosonic acid transferase [Phaeobacter sp. B1627]
MSRSPQQVRPTLLYHLYRGATALIAPLAWSRVAGKLRDYGLPEERVRERLGHASLSRPAGRLVWFHAASVGESLSVLTLIHRLGEAAPDLEFLVTSGTPTSAELIARRLPPRTRHQFPPLDSVAAVDRFLAHWQPDLGIFVESELWPHMLVRARAAAVPLILLNARLSPKSVARWQKRPKTARFLLDQFALMLTQNAQTAANLRSIGAAPERVQEGSNLKAVSDPLPVDQGTLRLMQEVLQGRPVWIASSTHEGEEAIVLDAHKALLADHPDLLLLLAPRHPNRGDAVAALVAEAGLTAARRSLQPASGTPLPEASTQVYLADTLGEVGTWYALCPLVFLGGSLREIGGHNPFEVMQAGGAVLTGPGAYNFAESFAELTALGAAIEITGADTLPAAIDRWLRQPDTLAAARAQGRAFLARQSDQMDKTIAALLSHLPHTR